MDTAPQLPYCDTVVGFRAPGEDLYNLLYCDLCCFVNHSSPTDLPAVPPHILVVIISPKQSVSVFQRHAVHFAVICLMNVCDENTISLNMYL